MPILFKACNAQLKASSQPFHLNRTLSEKYQEWFVSLYLRLTEKQHVSFVQTLTTSCVHIWTYQVKGNWTYLILRTCHSQWNPGGDGSMLCASQVCWLSTVIVVIEILCQIKTIWWYFFLYFCCHCRVFGRKCTRVRTCMVVGALLMLLYLHEDSTTDYKIVRHQVDVRRMAVKQRHQPQIPPTPGQDSNKTHLLPTSHFTSLPGHIKHFLYYIHCRHFPM